MQLSTSDTAPEHHPPRENLQSSQHGAIRLIPTTSNPTRHDTTRPTYARQLRLLSVAQNIMRVASNLIGRTNEKERKYAVSRPSLPTHFPECKKSHPLSNRGTFRHTPAMVNED
ncbi:hypothetical protein EYC84_007204 [Monilinia fructicola]|uniref:Uncharacterized protein n=1 Tax=Monilinia fructicola TaxID=38448 RepID=A0A5M9KA17_MONFR|nr:hypothetical protein EYC84_007204 [Monilinia fructicola]